MSTSTRTASIAATVLASLAVSASAAADDWAHQGVAAERFGPLDPAIQVAMTAQREQVDPAIATALAAHSAQQGRAAARPHAAQTPSAGATNSFDWLDAGIGAGAALLMALLVALASLFGVRHSRGRLRSA
jgi:hypothetical protein